VHSFINSFIHIRLIKSLTCRKPYNDAGEINVTQLTCFDLRTNCEKLAFANNYHHSLRNETTYNNVKYKIYIS